MDLNGWKNNKLYFPVSLPVRLSCPWVVLLMYWVVLLTLVVVGDSVTSWPVKLDKKVYFYEGYHVQIIRDDFKFVKMHLMNCMTICIIILDNR